MNAPSPSSRLRARLSVHLRAVRKVYGFLLRVQSPRSRGIDFIEVSSGSFASQPGDIIDVHLTDEGERVTSFTLNVLRYHGRDV